MMLIVRQCRSGSYLLYGLVSTIAWLLRAASSILSHHVMLMYQRAHIADPAVDLRATKRSVGHLVAIFLAHVTRVFGKFLVAGNAIWLLASSLFEYVGLYDSCWYVFLFCYNLLTWYLWRRAERPMGGK